MKTLALKIACAVLFLAIIITVYVGRDLRKQNEKSEYTDGIEQIDPHSIYLEESKTEVNFSEVLLSGQEEERKLIVSSETATIDFRLTKYLFKDVEFDFTKKEQNIRYTCKVNYIVDLSKLDKADIIDDKDNKCLTIMIEHPGPEEVKIDPDKVRIGSTNSGWLNPGKIKMTVSDFNDIEQEITKRIAAQINTSENGQKADDNAQKAVKEVYEPIVKAIDNRYSVAVEFKK